MKRESFTTALGDGQNGPIGRSESTARPGHVKLPGAERAVVDPSKVHDYLLSEAHPVGRFKAAFFLRIGYTPAAGETLGAALRGHALENEASLAEANPYGQKYEVRGSLRGPTGRAVFLISVWIVLRGEDTPRFVTAYPGPKR